MLYIQHPRPSVIENVEKMINCGDPAFGGAMFGCSKCGNLKFIPFRCHCRFCPTCGNKYSMGRATTMSFKIINVIHRHSVITRMFYKQNKSEMFTPGFICVLHTFGRDLKQNPHIHCLVSEAGMGNSGLWHNNHHLNYTFLRNAFCTALLNLLEKKLGTFFKAVNSKYAFDG